MTRMWTRIGLITILAVVLLAGCRASTAAGDAPEGFALYQGSGYSLAYPEGWEVRTAGDVDDSTREVEIHGPEDAAGYRHVITAAIPDDAPVTIGQYVTMFNLNADAQLAEREIVADDAVEVSGADEAHRIEVRYLVSTGDDDLEVRQVDVLALADGTAFGLRVAALAADFDEDLAEAVLASLRVDG
jgi:hypothetical protein